MSDPDEACADLADLAAAAREQPVVSSYSDLTARMLHRKHGIETVDGIETFYERLSDPTYRFDSDIIVRDANAAFDLDRSLTTYQPPDLPYIEYTGSAYTSALNQQTTSEWLDWQAVQETTLNQSAIAGRIVANTSRTDVVALVIVDGLSYADWNRVGEAATPVYVDCPTITACGYPNVVHGGSSGKTLARRLHNQGFKNRRAFTYWEKEHNALTSRLHQPFSPTDVVGDVEDFSDVMAHLDSIDWKTAGRTYLQITLTGPERVAHRMKEDPNVDAQVEMVRTKLEQLWTLLSDRVTSPRVFATADHGILWRMDVSEGFTELEGSWDHNQRRHLADPPAEFDLPTHVGRSEIWGGTEYFRLEYPYLFYPLRSNEPGTHGGFSFQESVVPLIDYT